MIKTVDFIMSKTPVGKWLKVQKHKQIYIGQERSKRLGDTNIKKIMKYAPKLNKSIALQTQNKEYFVTTDIENNIFQNGTTLL